MYLRYVLYTQIVLELPIKETCIQEPYDLNMEEKSMLLLYRFSKVKNVSQVKFEEENM